MHVLLTHYFLTSFVISCFSFVVLLSVFDIRYFQKNKNLQNSYDINICCLYWYLALSFTNNSKIFNFYFLCRSSLLCLLFRILNILYFKNMDDNYKNNNDYKDNNNISNWIDISWNTDQLICQLINSSYHNFLSKSKLQIDQYNNYNKHIELQLIPSKMVIIIIIIVSSTLF